MNEHNGMIQYTGVERRSMRVEPLGADHQPPPRRRRSDAVGRRHAAITTKILNWHSYRTWAHKARGGWEEGS